MAAHLTPVTWLLGPVASLHPALLFASVLIALVLYALATRFVTWRLAAVVCRLHFGFSPLGSWSLSETRLMAGKATFPPPMVIIFVELLSRQQFRPMIVGLDLAVPGDGAVLHQLPGPDDLRRHRCASERAS